jgi:hypothetical protein
LDNETSLPLIHEMVFLFIRCFSQEHRVLKLGHIALHSDKVGAEKNFHKVVLD